MKFTKASKHYATLFCPGFKVIVGLQCFLVERLQFALSKSRCCQLNCASKILCNKRQYYYTPYSMSTLLQQIGSQNPLYFNETESKHDLYLFKLLFPRSVLFRSNSNYLKVGALKIGPKPEKNEASLTAQVSVLFHVIITKLTAASRIISARVCVLDCLLKNSDF